MSERFDDRVRLLVAELIDSSPEAPPLPSVEAARLGWVRWAAAGATAVIALVVGLAIFLPGAEDQAALPDTTMATETTASAGTTMPDAERAAAIAALDDACTVFDESGDLEGFREDVASVSPPPGAVTFLRGVDVQIARAIALAGRGDDAGVAEQLGRIKVLLTEFGAVECEGLGG